MRILVNHDGQQLGPYSLDEVRSALQAGSLNGTDLAWVEGTPAWVPLSSVLNAPAGALPAFSNPGPQQYGPSSTSGAAVASLILGILSFVFFCAYFLFSIPAIICGHVARSNIRNSQGRLTGDGLALSGLITGYVNLALFTLMFALSIPSMKSMKDKGEEVSVTSDAKQIVYACAEYANDNGGKYPLTLEELVPHLLEDRTLHRRGSAGFDYLAAGKTNPPNGSVVVVAKQANRLGQRVVGRVGGAAAIEKFDPHAELSHE